MCVWFIEKSDELSQSATFDQKLRYFTDQNGLKGGSNSEMNITNDRKKDWKSR